MNALEEITLEIKAIFLHLLQEELISLELINFSKGHEGPDMGRCVCVCVPDMGQCVCVCVCVRAGGGGEGTGLSAPKQQMKAARSKFTTI